MRRSIIGIDVLFARSHRAPLVRAGSWGPTQQLDNPKADETNDEQRANRVANAKRYSRASG